MGLEFRRRDYRAEERTHSLPKIRADSHPLTVPNRSHIQVEESNCVEDDFVDPLRASDATLQLLTNDINDVTINSEEKVADGVTSQLKAGKEWKQFKKMLMQRFPVSNTTPISMVGLFCVHGLEVSGVLLRGRDLHPGELDEGNEFDEDVNVISQQEYITKLQELKAQISQSWSSDDRVTSLRLSIKVARLLMDASVIQFYPTLFVLATDILDMIGELVWNRIKQKAEMNEEGKFMCSLPDNFKSSAISFDAKETCNNWFSKIAAVYELLPRIYLELALLPCWRFLHDNPDNILQRLVEMTRGIADPLASVYCRVYLIQRAQRFPQHGTGFLINCVNDLKVLLKTLIAPRETVDEHNSRKSKVLLTLIEPSIEYIVTSLFKDKQQMETSDMLVALGMWRNSSASSESCYCISILLHYVLKELPIRFACNHAVEILQVIECTDDSSFDQHLNFKLLGHRLCERIPEVSQVPLVLDKIIQILSFHNDLDAYLMVADAYLEIFLEHQLGDFLSVILDGTFERIHEEKIGENESMTLQSVLFKCLTHFGNIEDVLALNHFVDILDMMHGSSRNFISVHILTMATRNGQICDPTIIEVLFEVAHSLYDGTEFSNMRRDDYLHPAHVISRFVYMVNYGPVVESHLRFLSQCRGAFGSIIELQEMLVHSCNNIAVRAMRDADSSTSFVKSCLAFNEVTIPAIPAKLRQLNLYLETAEVALLGGFVSHVDGLIAAAVNCLLITESFDGAHFTEDVDGIISLICKLCGMLVIIPGSLEQGLAGTPEHILSFLDSCSWILPRMKMKVLSAVVLVSAALSQNQPVYPSCSGEVFSNHQLFHGVESYHKELLSLSGLVLPRMLNIIEQEPSKDTRGKMAIDALNCITSSFMMTDETTEACSKLVEVAKTCFSAGDKFLQSTLKYLDRLELPLAV